MNTFERIIKNACHALGFDIRRIPPNQIGVEPFKDMQTLTSDAGVDVIFDVGANSGQSILSFQKHFRSAQIHCFEPGEQVLSQLKKTAAAYPNVSVNPFALGEKEEKRLFHENSVTELSSFLKLDEAGWGEEKPEQAVEIKTLDGYAQQNNISAIDILKTDTQGYDLNVLEGGSMLLSENRVHLVYIEITLSTMYRGLPDLEETLHYMKNHNFDIVSFYNIHCKDDRLSFFDALFINKNYQRKS